MMLRPLFRLLLHGMLFTQLTSLLTISPNTMKNDAYFFKRGNFLLFYFSSSLLNFSLSPIKGVSETHLSISFSTNMIIEVIKQGTQLLDRSVLSELTLIFPPKRTLSSSFPGWSQFIPMIHRISFLLLYGN